MENYTRIIGGTSTNIRTPTVGEINQGNDQLTPYDSAKNNGYSNEMSQQLGNVSTELTNVIIAAGLTPDATLTQVLAALNILYTPIPVPAATESIAGISTLKYEHLPYSVNKAYTVSGAADFINKVSDTEISFDVDNGASFSSLSVTHADGTIETLTSLANVSSGLGSDGTYFILKEKGVSTAVVTSSTATITESVTAPGSPTDGDYWLDISQKPYIPYKRVAAAWVETQFVKLGEVVKTGGILGTPISYALNGRYDSGVFAVAASTTYDKPANIGSEEYVDFRLLFRESSSFIWQDLSAFAIQQQTVGGIGANRAMVDRNTLRIRTSDIAVSARFSNLTGSATSDRAITGEYRILAKRDL